MTITKQDLKQKVEDAWRARAEAQGWTRKSKKYRDYEVEFFVGAMAAINAAFPTDNPAELSPMVPVHWVINAMSGRPIVGDA